MRSDYNKVIVGFLHTDSLAWCWKEMF